MLHPVMTIRPDEVIRSGIVQPFSVRGMDPVQFARHEVDPFIQSLRPMGANYANGGVTMNGPLGIVTTEIRGPGFGASFGQTEIEARVGQTRLAFGLGGFAGGLLLGVLGGYLLFGRRRRG